MTNSKPFTPIAPTIAGAIADTRQPRIKLPPGSCDCHAHVFGPQQQYPFAPDCTYVPPEANVDSYLRMLRTIGCERGVVIHPTVYGTNNQCTIDALRAGKSALRGIVVIDEKVTDEQLEDMHQAGIRGIRLHPKAKDWNDVLKEGTRLAARIKPRDWHIQVFFDIRAMPEIEKPLTQLPVDVVIDHFSLASIADGVSGASFQAMLRLARHEHCWFKLMGPYRLSKQSPMYPDVNPFARALLAAAPDRCVWGTDWPHPNAHRIPNDGDLADMLPDWIPDAALLQKVMVDNPARRYGF